MKHAIRHIPKAYLNDTNFELLFPVGRQGGSYVGLSELLLGLGSLLRNRDQAVDTIRSIIKIRLESRSETSNNYFKALRALAKRVLKRNPSLTPEYTAVIGQTGDALDVHGHYVYLNPACDYTVAHDFADLQVSFRFNNGKLYSLLPNEVEIKEYECSNTGRIVACSHGYYFTITVPMHYGGRVDGALGDVRVRSSKEKHNLNEWLLRSCPAATSAQPKQNASSVLECTNDDDDKQEFCENFIANGLKDGLEKRRLTAEATQAQKQAS
jgi:hypothetical protein